MYISVFIMVPPDGIINLFPLLYRAVYSLGRILVLTMLCIGLLISNHNKIIISKTTLTFGVFLSISLILAIVHGANIRIWYGYFIALVLIILIVETYKEYVDELILAFYKVLEFWIYINFILMLMFPSGLYYNETNSSSLCWILGYKSSIQYYIVPALILGWINMYYRGHKIRYLILYVVSIFTTLIAENDMMLVGIIFFAFFVIKEIINKRTLFNIWLLYAIDIVFNVILVTGNIILYSNFYFLQLLSAMGKNTTLTRRASILWPKTIEMIKSHFIIGNGLYEEAERVTMYNSNNTFFRSLGHSHNQILEILFIGGIVLGISYIYIYIHIGKCLSRNNSSPINALFSFSVFLINFLMSVEIFLKNVGSSIWLVIYLATITPMIDYSFKNREDCCLIEIDEYST